MPPASFPNRPDGLSPDQQALLKLPFRIPPGFGMRVLPADERQERLIDLDEHAAPLDTLLIWEPPRRKHLYVISVDVSMGGGVGDYSVIDVTRVGTVREPDEQVAQFMTNEIDEIDLAYIIDPIGRLYQGKDSQSALVAIECNGPGLSTQNELQRHIGYTNLYIWQYLDAVEGHQFTTKYGWYTNQRTRPLILHRYVHSLKTTDPLTGYADYRINSPHTLHELADFQTPGPLWMGEAADGAHDDCIMAGAIGVFVATTLQHESRETVHETRRRIHAEADRAERIGQLKDQKVSYQSTDFSYASMMGRDFDEYGEPVENPYKGDDEHWM